MEIKPIRQLDVLGRIVIPKDVRVALGLKEADQLQIDVVDGKIVLTPVAQ